MRRATPAAASSSAGARRSSGSSGSIVRVVPVGGKKVCNGVEDGAGDLALAGPRDPGIALGRDDRDLVLGRVEADVAARDVVEHDGVQALALQLATSRL